jgi:hypothetical protein
VSSLKLFPFLATSVDDNGCNLPYVHFVDTELPPESFGKFATSINDTRAGIVDNGGAP